MIIPPDNKYLCCKDENSIYLYCLRTGKLSYCFKNVYDYHISGGLAVSNNNKNIISTGSDFSLKVFDGEARQEMYNFQSRADGGLVADISKDDKIFTLTDSENKILKVYDIHTMKKLREFTLECEETCTAISKDKKTIMIGRSVFQVSLDEIVAVSAKIPKASLFGGHDNFITLSWPKDIETQKELLSCLL